MLAPPPPRAEAVDERRVVPNGLGNVAQGGRAVDVVGGGPILAVGIVELGAAHGGDFRNAGREADTQTLGGLRE